VNGLLAPLNAEAAHEPEYDDVGLMEKSLKIIFALGLKIIFNLSMLKLVILVWLATIGELGMTGPNAVQAVEQEIK